MDKLFTDKVGDWVLLRKVNVNKDEHIMQANCGVIKVRSITITKNTQMKLIALSDDKMNFSSHFFSFSQEL